MVKINGDRNILLKNKKLKEYFGINYCVDLYRGCSVDLLRKEFSIKKYKGIIGLGLNEDAYMPIEKQYRLTREVLELIKEFNYSAFILTKSDLIIRDLDLLVDINNKNHVFVAFVMTTYSDELSKIIEPHVSVPSARFNAIKVLANAGIRVGVIMGPVMPFILNYEDNIKKTIEKTREFGGSFTIPDFEGALMPSFCKRINTNLENVENKHIGREENSYFNSIDNIDNLKNVFYSMARSSNLSTDIPFYKHNENDCKQLSIFDII